MGRYFKDAGYQPVTLANGISTVMTISALASAAGVGR